MNTQTLLDTPEISFDEVSLHFGKTTALHNVSFTLKRGTITALIGGDGAGKSSILRILAGLQRPSSGSIRNIPEQEFGYQPSSSGVWPNLSVIENLDFVADSYRLSAEERRIRITHLLQRAQLSEAKSRAGAKLSGGMRQKLGFSMALLHQPDLLILDEPTTGLDPVSRFELWKLIGAAAAEGTTVVLSTTYFDEAMRASQLIILDQGRILSQGTLQEVMRSAGAHAERRNLEEVVIALTERAQSALPVSTEPSETTAEPVTQPAPRNNTAPPLASLRGIQKRYGTHVAVDHVDLSIAPGEILGLIGANGAGKTTLIRILLGLERPTAGTVELFGEAPNQRSKQRIGYVAQGFGLFPTLSPKDNVEFAAAVHQVSVKPLPEIFKDSLSQPAGDLPLGLQRRLAFHCATLHKPTLLVLDEPTSGMDPLGRREVWRLAQAAAASGTGIIITTHYLEEAEHCDRVVALAGGKVAASGTVQEIIANHRATLVQEGNWQIAFQTLINVGLSVTLAGTDLRVSGSNPDAVREQLGSLAADYRISSAPATLEETILALSTAPESANDGS